MEEQDELNICHKLLLETLEDTPKEENAQSASTQEHLEDYFARKSKQNERDILNYLDTNQIATFIGEYLPNIGCYRFIINERIYDFPQNWLWLEEIHAEINLINKDKIFHIKNRDDGEHLVKSFSKIHPELNDIVFFIKGEKLHLSFFLKTDRTHLNQLTKLFLNSMSETKTIAA